MISRFTAAVVVAAPCLLVGGCQHSEDRYLRRTVAVTELPGTWTVTPYAVKSLRDIGFKDHLDPAEHLLTLSADGSCTFRSFADPATPGRSTYIATPAACQWSLGGTPPHQQLEVSVPARAEHRAFAQSYYFDSENGALVLWHHIADPDTWRYIEFSRKRQ
jgi:hypothetical protein